MKLLVVGDAHLKIGILDDARSFIDQLLSEIKNNKYDAVVLLGDQFDNFAVVRSEILALWTEFFVIASTHTQIIALVGNHDMAGAEGGTNPMEAFVAYKDVSIIDRTTMIPLGERRLFFLPFVRDNAAFEEVCRKIPAGELLFCHQSFNGAQFENGFYDPHGADPACVAHLSGVISGHVHRQQTVQNIWYPGTPFQHSFGDAGEEKFIFELTLGNQGYSISKKIALNMPEYVVLQAEDIPTLIERMEDNDPSPQMKVKLVAPGTPSEIQNFWQNPVVQRWKATCKRVSDGLTSIKMSQNTITTKGKTQKEKLEEFIRQKKWRTDGERLISRAEEFLRA